MRVARAYAYYFARVTDNAVSRFTKRLRQPKYLVGFLVILAYLTWVISVNFNNISSPEPTNLNHLSADDFLRAFALLQLAIAWVLGRFHRAFRFKVSETTWLFSAPLSRQHILAFKWVQSMPAMLVMCLFLSIFAFFSPSFHPVFAGLGLFLAWNLIFLHQLWARLFFQRCRNHGRLGEIVSWLIPAAVATALVWCIVETYGRASERGATHPFEFLSVAPFSRLWRLLEFFSAAPTADTWTQFTWAAGALLIAIIVQAWLVTRSDQSFEDEAVRSAERLSRLKSDGVDALRDPSAFVVSDRSAAFLRLSPMGAFWRAVVWKNILSFGRIGRRRAVLTLVFALYFGGIGAFFFGKFGDGTGVAVLGAVVVLLPYFTMLAPAIIRVDLRIDIPHFDVIKSLPIRGRDLIFGEVVAGTLVTFLIQVVLLLAGLAILLGQSHLVAMSRSDMIVLALAGVIALAGIDFALFVIANLMALYFPGLSRLGRGVKVGLDQFGTQFIGAMLRTIALSFQLIIPLTLAAFVAFGLVLMLGISSIIAAFIGSFIFSLLLILENFIVIRLAESRYDSFDLSQAVDS